MENKTKKGDEKEKVEEVKEPDMEEKVEEDKSDKDKELNEEEGINGSSRKGTMKTRRNDGMKTVKMTKILSSKTWC